MYVAGFTHNLIYASTLAASCLVACSSAGPVKATAPASSQAATVDRLPDTSKAEYAFRWYLPQKDFESAAHAVQWLQQHAGFFHPQIEEQRTVVYFAVAKPPGFPDGYGASFRLRGAADYTYKVRGPAPWPETLATPFCDGLKVDVEYDVSVGSDGKVATVMASHSCDGNSKAAFGGWLGTATLIQRPCTINMERTRLDWSADAGKSGKVPKELKVEEWTFSQLGYQRKLVEISWKAKATQSDQDIFSALVANMPKSFPAKLPPSKESTAAECDAGK